MSPPPGGEWVGHAVVTFVVEGRTAQGTNTAYVNIAKQGSLYEPAIVLVATPSPTAA